VFGSSGRAIASQVQALISNPNKNKQEKNEVAYF
jgi:hypothetical protein